MIDLQEDLASIFHPKPALAPHLSAIMRSPVPTQPDESIVPRSISGQGGGTRKNCCNRLMKATLRNRLTHSTAMELVRK